MTFIDFIAEFGVVVAALVIVLDPLALIPIALDVLSQMQPAEARRTILHVVGGAAVLLMFFTATGTWLLRLFGVTLNDLRIAGGLLLIVFAFKLVFEGTIGTPDRESGYQAAVVPLISPLLVGPGAITAAIVLASEHGVVLTLAAGIVAMLISLGLLMSALFIHRLLGDVGTDLMSRVMGLLIATIAVSYVREGVVGLLHSGGLH